MRAETTPHGGITDEYGVDRVSDADLAFLAMDQGPVPQQVAVVLVLDGQLTAEACARLLAVRTAAVSRLRQRLVRTPPGCGPPIWIDDDQFTAARHLEFVTCPSPGADRELLDTVTPLVLRPLPRGRPLWRAVLVSGVAGGRCALLLVTHHVLSDGLGGLAVLGRLLDGAPPAVTSPPAPRPAVRRLVLDAWRSRAGSLRTTPNRLRRLRTAIVASGGMAPPRAQPCSLLWATGAHRRSVLVRAPLSELRDAAHRNGGTVNAALLCAVSEALVRLLNQRGETVGAIAVAVPVGTPSAAGGLAGNSVSPLLITVPATGSRGRRLAAVTADVRSRRAGAAGPAPITVLGGWFRLLAALGGYRWYMTHQRRLHTLVSCVRGPEAPVRLGGCTVRDMIPVVVGGPTNITVSFLALTYAGSLAVTIVADPGHCRDLDRLGRFLSAALTAFSNLP